MNSKKCDFYKDEYSFDQNYQNMLELIWDNLDNKDNYETIIKFIDAFLDSHDYILDIIRSKKLDVGTYIFNTDNWEEYMSEVKHLDYKYKLDLDEYNLLKKFFN